LATAGIHHVTAIVSDPQRNLDFYAGTLGFHAVREQASIFRYAAQTRDIGSIVDLRQVPGLWPGVMGAGTIHHVAFRAEDDAAQKKARRSRCHNGSNLGGSR